MDVTSAALEGMSRAEARLETAAARLSRATAPLDATDPVDIVDVSTEMVRLMDARTSFQANVNVLEIANEMSRNLLDILG